MANSKATRNAQSVNRIDNLKTINGESLEGGGNIVISGSGGETNLSYTASATDGTVTSDTGTSATIPAGSNTNASLMLPSDKTKLNGIAPAATANSSDAFLLARTNHTGTQSAGTITGLATVATTGTYADLTGKPDLTAYASKRVPTVAATTASYTILDTSLNAEIISSASVAQTLTISNTLNTAATIGDKISIIWYGVGVPSIAVSGSQTINSGTSAILLAKRYNGVVITKFANNTWIVSGAIS